MPPQWEPSMPNLLLKMMTSLMNFIAQIVVRLCYCYLSLLCANCRFVLIVVGHQLVTHNRMLDVVEEQTPTIVSVIVAAIATIT